MHALQSVGASGGTPQADCSSPTRALPCGELWCDVCGLRVAEVRLVRQGQPRASRGAGRAARRGTLLDAGADRVLVGILVLG